MSSAPSDPAEVIAALAELGVFKPGEQPRLFHQHGCRHRQGECTCPGGPELVYADWNELVPPPYLLDIPERFYARY